MAIGGGKRLLFLTPTVKTLSASVTVQSVPESFPVQFVSKLYTCKHIHMRLPYKQLYGNRGCRIGRHFHAASGCVAGHRPNLVSVVVGSLIPISVCSADPQRLENPTRFFRDKILEISVTPWLKWQKEFCKT